MDKTYSITNETERKPGQHLGPEERGAIQHMKQLDLSNRSIARMAWLQPIYHRL